jgi:predicted phosphodiesterase
VRVAALYDVHGNLPALEAVLAEVEREGVDLVVSGGDVVAGPFPRETLGLLLALGDRVRFVRGNGDRMTVELADGVDEPGQRPRDWVLAQLGPEHVDALRSFEPTVTVDVDGLGPTLFCHATARSDEEVFLETTAEAIVAPMIAGAAEATIVCGHTHMQLDRQLAGKRVVNAGSVGMPYEAAPGAYWALLGPGVELRRTDYDREAAAELFRASGHPEAEELARENVLTVPSRAEALAAFEPLVARGA